MAWEAAAPRAAGRSRRPLFPPLSLPRVAGFRLLDNAQKSSSVSPRSARDPANLLRVTHAASKEGEMHDPLLDDCFSFSRGAPFRDAAIAGAAEYYVDSSFLKLTISAFPTKKLQFQMNKYEPTYI